MSNPALQTLLEDLPSDRSVLPHQYNVQADQLLLVRLDPAAQEAASFLDERVLAPDTKGAWFDWSRMEAVASKLAEQHPRYIFHMGHCGSTLLSRLLAAAADMVALREPLPLRTLAFDAAEGAGAFLNKEGFAQRLGILERCWARGDRPALVKATSMCTGLAQRTGSSFPSLFLYQTPEIHLAALMAATSASVSLKGFAQMRHRRLRQHYDAPPLAGSTLGELAAQAWLAEALDAAEAHQADRMTFLNFETFLKDPAESLKRVCKTFGVSATPQKIAETLSGPIMKTYSKAPDHAFSPSDRAQRLAEARKTRVDEIAKGLAWLEQAGKDDAGAAAAVGMFSA